MTKTGPTCRIPATIETGLETSLKASLKAEINSDQWEIYLWSLHCVLPSWLPEGVTLYQKTGKNQPTLITRFPDG